MLIPHWIIWTFVALLTLSIYVSRYWKSQARQYAEVSTTWQRMFHKQRDGIESPPPGSKMKLTGPLGAFFAWILGF